MSSSAAQNIYLHRVGKELVLFEGQNLSKTSPKLKNVLVIGGGVTGLTTAWGLLDAGYNVTVVSEKWASLEERITSQIAGALWEWPPAVCGKHQNHISLEKSKEWCLTSYRNLETLMETLPVEEHGIRMRMANFFFSRAMESMPGQMKKMVEIMAVPEIQGFQRDRNLIQQHKVNQEAGVIDSYQHLAPVIDTDHYMFWLRDLIAGKGAQFVTAKITGDLVQNEDKLLAQYNADVIVNATGLGAFDLAADSTVYPLRGALIRVINDGKRFPKVTEALCVSHDDTQGSDIEDIVFIVPRNDQTLILGGLAQVNEDKLDLTLESPEIVRMRKRCNDFVPGLENAEYDPVPFVQGLRPCTLDNVRVERELRPKKDGSLSRTVHSYGQGGSGFTLSFGCAGDILDLVQQMEKEVSSTVESIKAQL